MSDNLPTIAVLGGTGPQGSGLALRWAQAGYRVIIASRDAQKSRQTAAELNARLGLQSISGDTHEAAAKEAAISVLTVPYAAQAEVGLRVQRQLAGKILVDVTVPLIPPKVGTIRLPAGGSAVLALQEKLGPEVRVISAFQNIAAQHLHDLGHEIECDVLVCGDDNDACEATTILASAAGLKAWRAGPLANSVAAEAFTSILITINRRYKIPGSGFRITGQATRQAE